jgi:hypothetical protein
MRVRFVSSTGFRLLGIWLLITGIMQALSIGNPTWVYLLFLLGLLSCSVDKVLCATGRPHGTRAFTIPVNGLRRELN